MNSLSIETINLHSPYIVGFVGCAIKIAQTVICIIEEFFQKNPEVNEVTHLIIYIIGQELNFLPDVIIDYFST